MLAIVSSLPGVTVTGREDLCIVGAPIDIGGCRTGVHKAVERLSSMSSRLKSIEANPAFLLLLNCLSMPRLLFKLINTQNRQFDKTLRQAASTVCNVMVDDTWWQQSALLVA